MRLHKLREKKIKKGVKIDNEMLYDDLVALCNDDAWPRAWMKFCWEKQLLLDRQNNPCEIDGCRGKIKLL